MSGDATIRRTILVVGDKEVGKTCIVQCFRDWANGLDFTSPVSTDNEPTIGVDPHIVEFKIGCHFRLSILDTSGDDKFNQVVRTHYNGHVVLLVYDVNNPATYTKALTHFLPQIRIRPLDGVPIILVGNKQEKDDVLSISSNEEAYNRPYDMPTECMYAAVSCRTGLGVYDLFDTIINLCAREKVGMEEALGGAELR